MARDQGQLNRLMDEIDFAIRGVFAILKRIEKWNYAIKGDYGENEERSCDLV
jgi:hypothetical protein